MNERQVSTGPSEIAKVRYVEGFRVPEAYEILTWRNPRAPCTGLWVKGLWDGSAWQALPSRECCQGSDYRHVDTARLRLVCVSLGLLLGVRIEFGIGVHCLTDQVAVTVIVLLCQPCRVMTRFPGSALPILAAREFAASVRRSR